MPRSAASSRRTGGPTGVILSAERSRSMAAPFPYGSAYSERLDTSEEQSLGIHVECDADADGPEGWTLVVEGKTGTGM